MGLEVADFPFQSLTLLGERQQLSFVLFLDLVQTGGKVTAEFGASFIRARVTGAVVENEYYARNASWCLTPWMRSTPPSRLWSYPAQPSR